MSKIFIIAELSANHNHNLQTAIESIKAAAAIGVDAVKIQTYTADTITIDCHNDDFLIKGGLWNGYTYYDLYREAYTPWEWHAELFKVAREEGIMMFSTPFDKTAVDFLESLDNPIYKIASFEIMDTELIRYAASKGKPMIMSTGIATEEEIEDAIRTCREAGNNDITLLKCTSEYPAKIEDANLAMIPAMREHFGVNVGLSDHSIGSLVPTVAVALGATVVEKHFIIDRAIGGPDSGFSMNKEEFAAMVKDIRDAENSLGTVSFDITQKVAEARKSGRSLYVVADISAGSIISTDDIRCIRPGQSLHPKFYRDIIGHVAKHDLHFGDRISLDDII